MWSNSPIELHGRRWVSNKLAPLKDVWEGLATQDHGDQETLGVGEHPPGNNHVRMETLSCNAECPLKGQQ